MPLKKGKSKEVIKSNIKEMVAAGHPLKQAIAASLANSRKYAMGGYVDEDLDDEHERDIVELNEEASEQGPVANPETQMQEKKLADTLHQESEAAEAFADGGIVESEGEASMPGGNMPDEEAVMTAYKEILMKRKKQA